MEPIGRFARDANARFVIGQTYALEEIQERSTASHRHFFSTVTDVWRNLPEHLSDRFPSADALRAHALIQTGHFNETRLDAGTNAAALRVAAVMRADEPLAAVVVRGPLVVRRIARSQSYRKMDKGEFQSSKADVLDFLSDMIGVEVGTLHRQAAA
jgi:hypothetical protein